MLIAHLRQIAAAVVLCSPLLLGAVALVGAPISQAQAQAALTPEQRKAVVDIIRETLTKNPELIQEALIELEKRNQQAQVDAQKNALTSEKATLFDNPKSAIAGNPQGDVTIVEFMDYNCGYCKRAMEDMRAIIKDDPKLKVVLKEFPVLGPDSVEAARVATAVKNQIKGDKFWEFHVKLMATRGKVNAARALELAKEAGANVDQVRKDMESAETRGAIEETVALGDRLGLTGTPAFVLGDEVIFGAVGADVLKGKISAMRKCGKTVCSG
ncbi:MAG: DsbA family protein [Bosea sp. (in: a-proteobacteria)]